MINLNLPSRENILGHEVQLAASNFVPVNVSIIPTGELSTVEGTPFDFRTMKKIADGLDASDIQLMRGNGFDHCWVVDNYSNDLVRIGKVYDPISGRMLTVFTTEPGVQFYTGNFLDGTLTGKDGIVYNKRMGLCLETQHFPDSPNQLEFPSVILNPSEEFNSKTVYQFSVQ